MNRKPITTEQLIQADVADILTTTRQPHMRNKWDWRVRELGYIDEQIATNESASFVYWTPLGCRHSAHGAGITETEFDPLKKTTVTISSFKSHGKYPLIRSGSGQQKLKVTANGTLWKTSLDYEVGWGVFGRIFDHILLRPIVQWTTAYSSDALRIWLNHGLHPRTLQRRTILQAVLYVLMLTLTTIILLMNVMLNDQPLPTMLLLGLGIAAWMNSADLPSARNSKSHTE